MVSEGWSRHDLSGILCLYRGPRGEVWPYSIPKVRLHAHVLRFRHYMQIAVMAALNPRGWAKRGRKRRGMR